MLGNDIRWWIGSVENRFDPIKRGRIQVRIFGVHSKETVKNDNTGQGIPTEDLPWAMTGMPLTYGGMPVGGTVPPPAVMPGAWVYGISIDGDAYNDLLVLGVLPIGCIADVATNPFNVGTYAVTGSGLKTLSAKKEEFVPSDSCSDKFKKSIEKVQAETNSRDDIIAGKPTLGITQFVSKRAIDNFKAALDIPAIREKIEKQTGVKFNKEEVIEKIQTDATFNKIMAEGLYTSYLKHYNDPVIAALAFDRGPALTDKIIQEIGDPRKHEITYDELANELIATNTAGGIDAGRYITRFMNEFTGEHKKCINQ